MQVMLMFGCRAWLILEKLFSCGKKLVKNEMQFIEDLRCKSCIGKFVNLPIQMMRCLFSSETDVNLMDIIIIVDGGEECFHFIQRFTS